MLLGWNFDCLLQASVPSFSVMTTTKDSRTEDVAVAEMSRHACQLHSASQPEPVQR